MQEPMSGCQCRGKQPLVDVSLPRPCTSQGFVRPAASPTKRQEAAGREAFGGREAGSHARPGAGKRLVGRAKQGSVG